MKINENVRPTRAYFDEYGKYIRMWLGKSYEQVIGTIVAFPTDACVAVKWDNAHQDYVAGGWSGDTSVWDRNDKDLELAIDNQ